MRKCISACCDSLSNLYLWHIKYSPCWPWALPSTGCDSLSNLYLWHIKYSIPLKILFKHIVVIRFQICIFDILNTANINLIPVFIRCDSLSNLYLWHIKYSHAARSALSVHVVIRFQICIFDILNTAPMSPVIYSV